jgi:hypothetical protein
MHGGYAGKAKSRTARYFCYSRQEGSGCGQPSVAADGVEDALADYVKQFRPTLADKKAVIRLHKASQGRHGQAVEADRARQRIETALQRMKQQFRWGTSPRRSTSTSIRL